MYGQALERQVAATLLISCGFIFAVGGILFTGRTIWKWNIGQTPRFLKWERGFVITALLINVLGLVLLEDLLRAAGGLIIAQMALILYLIGAVVVIVAELSYLHNREWIYTQIVFHVVVAFLAQGAFGVAILLTAIVPAWAGWATLIWNIGCLLVLIFGSPRDIYFPVLHHVAPLIIGIALLVGK